MVLLPGTDAPSFTVPNPFNVLCSANGTTLLSGVFSRRRSTTQHICAMRNQLQMPRIRTRRILTNDVIGLFIRGNRTAEVNVRPAMRQHLLTVSEADYSVVPSRAATVSSCGPRPADVVILIRHVEVEAFKRRTAFRRSPRNAKRALRTAFTSKSVGRFPASAVAVRVGHTEKYTRPAGTLTRLREVMPNGYFCRANGRTISSGR